MPNGAKVVNLFGSSKGPSRGTYRPKEVPHTPNADTGRTASPASEQQGNETLRQTALDLAYMIENGDFVADMRDRLDEATRTIFSCKGFVANPESIRLRRDGLKSWSLQNICEAISEAHEFTWRRKPSYIGALTMEYDARIKAAMRYCRAMNIAETGNL